MHINVQRCLTLSSDQLLRFMFGFLYFLHQLRYYTKITRKISFVSLLSYFQPDGEKKTLTDSTVTLR